MTERKVRFAYVSSENPMNKRVWSGTHYSIYKSLLQIGDVEILGPYEPKLTLWFLKVLNQLRLKLSGKRISYRHGIILSKTYGKYFTKKLTEGHFDFIIAPAASSEIAHLKTNIPVIYITDGTFKSCLNYHKSLSNLSRRSIYEGNYIEQLAISKSKHVIVPSNWAANSVMQDYKKNKNDVSMIPFGANFDQIPDKLIEPISENKTFKLLFIGVYWDSKGGDIAYNAFKILINKGFNVTLTVVGCKPPEEIFHPNLHVISFIDKNSEAGQIELKNIYSQHQLLLLPTRFDCSPIVINEASAFGMPCLVSKSGGVEGHLKDNINGHLINYNDQGELFSKEIEKLILNPSDYLSLRKSSRALYESDLNWKNWTEHLKQIISK